MADPVEAPDTSPWGFPSPNFDALKSQWDQTLADPRGQAAVLSFAAQALQPRQFGQSTAGLLGESLAKGGEAIRGIDTQEMKKEELQSKQDLREAQANAASARADTATTRTDLSGARLALQQQGQENVQSRNVMGGRLRVQTLYNQEKKAAEDAARKADLLGLPAPAKVPSFFDWLATKPEYHSLYEGTGTMGQGSPATAPPTGTPTPTAPNSGVAPAPTKPTDRVKGTYYETPQGPLQWTGTGWIK